MQRILAAGLVTLFFSLSILPGLAYEEYAVGEVKSYSSPTYTRLVVEVSLETGYVVRDLLNPPRLIFNLYPANLTPPRREIEIADRFLRRVRLERDSLNVVKMVLDLAGSDYTYNVFSLENPPQLVIDIREARGDLIAELLKRKEDTESLPLKPQKERLEGIKRVILDPGHGGKDPGAIGPTGLQEKKVTLAIAKKLAQLLREKLGLQVYLTRNKDEYLALDRRTEIADQLGGDLFVSIHANAAYDRKVSGVETFYNSQYVYGEGAEEVASRENAPLGAELPAGAKTILWDLIQNEYRRESNELSHVIQDALCQSCGLANRGVKSARFYVLRGADMPAVLVEVGFISNPWEERKLGNKDFQDKIVRGIFQGLSSYIRSFNEKVER